MTGRTPLGRWTEDAPRATAIVGVSIISFTAILVRLADVSPITASFYRPAYALPALLLIAWTTGALRRRNMRQRLLGFIAGLAFAGDLAFWHLSIENIGAGLATVLGNTQAVLVMIAGWFLYRERPTTLAITMVPVVIIGVVLIAGVAGGELQGDNPALGVVFGLATAIFYMIFLLVLRRAGDDSGSPVGPLLEASFGAAVGAVLLAPFDGDFELLPSWPSHGWLLLLGLGSQVVGWLLITSALPRVEAWQTSVLLVLQPAGTVLWAYLLLDEAIATTQAVGVVLVVISVGLASARRSQPVVAAPAAISASRAWRRSEAGFGDDPGRVGDDALHSRHAFDQDPFDPRHQGGN